MTRWEILEKAKEVLDGKYGNGGLRECMLGENYKPVQKVVDAILDGEDYISKEIEKRQEEIRFRTEERFDTDRKRTMWRGELTTSNRK